MAKRDYLCFERTPRPEEVEENPPEQIEELEHPAFIARFGRAGQGDKICGRDTIILPTWYDVDDVDTLKRLFRETVVEARQHIGDQTPFFPSHTAAALRRLLETEDFAKRLDPPLRESLTARIA